LFLKPAPGGGYRLLSDVENMKSPWRGDKIWADLQWWQKQKQISSKCKFQCDWSGLCWLQEGGGGLRRETIICVVIAMVVGVVRGAMTQLCFKGCPSIVGWLIEKGKWGHRIPAKCSLLSLSPWVPGVLMLCIFTCCFVPTRLASCSRRHWVLQAVVPAVPSV
jgi:hypothetical protein